MEGRWRKLSATLLSWAEWMDGWMDGWMDYGWVERLGVALWVCDWLGGGDDDGGSRGIGMG
jgi:hypothetical protein